MDEIKRLTPAQRARCNRLIRRLCANYDGGNCLPLDDGEGCVCADDFLFAAVQVFSAGGSARRQGTLCRHLPEAHTAPRPMRKALCPVSNRQKYCPECGRSIRRKQKADSARRRRSVEH